MNYKNFLHKNSIILDRYWSFVKPDILNWKNSYEWPKNVKLEKAIILRNELELIINGDLRHYNYLTKDVFDQVMVWGFGRISNNSEVEIKEQTKKAFYYLRKDQIEQAAIELLKMRGIGISRASKILALSNQRDYGIYDSRSAHGLSDLTFFDKKRLPIPPGRVVSGDVHLNNYDFCYGFQNYTWVMRYLKEKAIQEPNLKQYFSRVSDIEIAFFTRSRLGMKTTTSHYNVNTKYNNTMVNLDEKLASLLKILSEPSDDDDYKRKSKQVLAEIKADCESVSQMYVPDNYQLAGLTNKKAAVILSIAIDLIENIDQLGDGEINKIDRHIKKYLRFRMLSTRVMKYERFCNSIFNLK
jgi:hypothetical protein